MTDPALGTSQAQPAATAPFVTPEVAAMVEQATAGPAPTQAPGEGATPAADQAAPGTPAQAAQLTGEHVVDWGGTPRTVNIQDLVAAAQDRENAQTLNQAADQRMAKFGAYQALEDAEKSWTDGQRAAFKAAIADPTLFDTMGQQQQQSVPELPTDEFDATMLHSPGPNQQPSNTDKQIGMLNEAVSALLNRASTDEGKQAETRLGDQVDKTMGSFGVFGHKGAAHYAKQQIMMAMGQNPGQDLDTLVAQHASAVQGMFTQSAARPVEPAAGGVVQFPHMAAQTPLTGDQLASGESRDIAARLFQQMTGGG